MIIQSQYWFIIGPTKLTSHSQHYK